MAGNGLDGGSGVDTLVLQNLTETDMDNGVSNFETAVVEASTLTVTDGEISLADHTILTGGSTLDAQGGMTMTGSLTIDAGSSLLGLGAAGSAPASAGSLAQSAVVGRAGAATGIYAISGDVVNNGVITTQNGEVGEVVQVGGNYSGSGAYLVDTNLTSGQSDSMTIAGDASGSTQVGINLVGTDVNNLSTEAVTIVDVAGSGVDTAFNFAGLEVGALSYDLVVQNGQLVLVPVLSGTAAIYEGYIPNLMTFADLGSMYERRGGRLAAPSTDGALGVTQWARYSGAQGTTKADNSATGSSYDNQSSSIAGGVDVVLYDGGYGSLTSSVNAGFGEANTDVTHSLDTGSIESTGVSFGGGLTWMARGVYVDLQGRNTWVSSDMVSADKGAILNENEGTVWAGSAEIGTQFRTPWGISATPQVQLSYAELGFDSFEGAAGGTVSVGEADSLKLRLGSTLEYDKTWGFDENNYAQVYGVVNFEREMSEDNYATQSGQQLVAGQTDWSQELGLGTTVSLRGGVVEVFGQGSIEGSLGSWDDNHAVKGNFGMRLNF